MKKENKKVKASNKFAITWIWIFAILACITLWLFVYEMALPYYGLAVASPLIIGEFIMLFLAVGE